MNFTLPINTLACLSCLLTINKYIYSFPSVKLRKVAGGHINPAVSTMFWSLGKLSTFRLGFYILAQIAGAFVGAALVYMTYFGMFFNLCNT